MAEFHLARGGQTIGIYPEDKMREFWTEGRVAPDDLVWRPGMADWLPAARVFGAAQIALPLPPRLHWGWVLVLSIVTVGLFYVVWALVQAMWVRRIDPKSRAVALLVVYIVLAVIGEFVADAAPRQSRLVIVGALLSLTGMIISIVAFFSMRRSLLAHYNEAEPVGLRLSRVMTLIFNVLYFQHHFTRIAKWKAGGALAPQ